SNRCLRRHRDWLAFGDGADDRLECADHFQHIGRGNRKRLSGFNRLGEGFQQYAQRIRRWVNFCFRAPPINARVSEVSSRASAGPLTPNTWIRQNIGAARTVESKPVAPLSNCTRAAVASRGSGGVDTGVDFDDWADQVHERIEHM